MEGGRKRQRSSSPCEGNETKKQCIGSYHSESESLSSFQQESMSMSVNDTLDTNNLRGAANENHFIGHLRGFQGYNHLGETIEATTPIWQRFLVTLMQRDMNHKVSTGNTADPRVSIIRYGSTYITFTMEHDTQVASVSVCCFFVGVSIQIMMSKEQISFSEQMSENDEFVDELVEWLHQQVTSGVMKLGNCLNPSLFNHHYVRKFAKVNCMLRFYKLSDRNLLH